MAVFSTNQNRHMFVGKLGSTNPSTHVTTLANPGDIAVDHTGDGKDLQVFFKYVNKKGEIIKSDYIPVQNLDYVKPVKASAMARPLKKVKVELSTAINSGNPVSGQDYVLRITFFQWIGGSDKYTYVKDAAVHVTAAMTADKKEFYKAMVAALNLAFSRELGATKDANPYLAFSAGTSGSENGIYIEEKKQPWSLGTESLERVLFEVQPTLIYTDGDDIIWAKENTTTGKYYTDLTSSNSNKITNGEQIADLEYFSLGERGDQYRNVGWPNVVNTEGLADPSKQYNVLELHFAFKDEGVNDYRSEKDVTIAVPLSDTTAQGSTIYDDINALIDELEYHSGLTIAGLADA